MDLYDADWPDGLFDAHLNACRGALAPGLAREPRRPVRAHGIVYARARLRITSNIGFPAWCSDIPRPGSDLAIDVPVCYRARRRHDARADHCGS